MEMIDVEGPIYVYTENSSQLSLVVAADEITAHLYE